MLVQPVSEYFRWCRKYYRLRSCLTRGCLRCLWIAVTGTKFLFIFSKNYTPWSFQFFIPVWNCRATRNKSDASCSGKPWVYLKGVLKFPLSLLFYRFNIHTCFKEASSIILSIPFKIPISLALNVFYFVNIFLRVWGFGLDKLRFNQLQAGYYHFPSSVLVYHIPHFICLSVSPRSKRLLSRMTYDDSHYHNDFPLSSTEFTLNKPSRFFFLTNTIPLLYLCQFSCSVMSDSLQPQGLQHTRLPSP